MIEEGEPSDWLQLGGAEPSIIGDAPDSIAIVPAVPKEPVVERSARPPEPEEIELTTPAEVEDAFEEELAPAPARARRVRRPRPRRWQRRSPAPTRPSLRFISSTTRRSAFEAEDEHPTIPATESNPLTRSTRKTRRSRAAG